MLAFPGVSTDISTRVAVEAVGVLYRNVGEKVALTSAKQPLLPVVYQSGIVPFSWPLAGLIIDGLFVSVSLVLVDGLYAI
jgi:hypothetical protein